MAAATVAVLDDDMLAAILRRLPARSLAATRRVCKAWRGVVDQRRLLLPYLLPRSVRRIFFIDYHQDTFFAGPPVAAQADEASPWIDDGVYGFIEEDNRGRWSRVDFDHNCNGLVLYWDDGTGSFYICNPMTSECKRLPQCSGDVWRWKHARKLRLV